MQNSLADICLYEFVLCFDVKKLTPEVCPSTLDTLCSYNWGVYTHTISTSGIATHELWPLLYCSMYVIIPSKYNRSVLLFTLFSVYLSINKQSARTLPSLEITNLTFAICTEFDVQVTVHRDKFL